MCTLSLFIYLFIYYCYSICCKFLAPNREYLNLFLFISYVKFNGRYYYVIKSWKYWNNFTWKILAENLCCFLFFIFFSLFCNLHNFPLAQNKKTKKKRKLLLLRYYYYYFWIVTVTVNNVHVNNNKNKTETKN